jgi:hypothetical protein
LREEWGNLFRALLRLKQAHGFSLHRDLAKSCISSKRARHVTPFHVPSFCWSPPGTTGESQLARRNMPLRQRPVEMRQTEVVTLLAMGAAMGVKACPQTFSIRCCDLGVSPVFTKLLLPKN